MKLFLKLRAGTSLSIGFNQHQCFTWVRARTSESPSTKRHSGGQNPGIEPGTADEVDPCALSGLEHCDGQAGLKWSYGNHQLGYDLPRCASVVLKGADGRGAGDQH
jgi:hypothetical protein